MKTRLLLCLIIFLSMTPAIFSQEADIHPLNGAWTGEWWPYPDFDYPLSAGSRWDPIAAEKMSRTNPNPQKLVIEMKWDGQKLAGTLNPGPKAVALQMVAFNAETGVVHIETDAKDPQGKPIHYVIEGKLKKDTISGSWTHALSSGDFKIKKK